MVINVCVSDDASKILCMHHHNYGFVANIVGSCEEV